MLAAKALRNLNFKNARFLVVEDEDVTRALIVDILRSLECYEVVATESAHEALDRLQNHANSFDVILADYNMPGIDGLELLKMIRVGTKAVSRDIGYAMLTSYAEPHVVHAAFSLDIDSFIKKPVSRNALRDRLTRVLLTSRPVKTPLDYVKIPIADEELAERLDSEDTLDPVEGATVNAGVFLDRKHIAGVATELSQIKPSSILCEDLRGPGGNLLIGEGTILTERILARLTDLEEIGFKPGKLHVLDSFAP